MRQSESQIALAQTRVIIGAFVCPTAGWPLAQSWNLQLLCSQVMLNSADEKVAPNS
jgi:hypothetical protein